MGLCWEKPVQSQKPLGLQPLQGGIPLVFSCISWSLNIATLSLYHHKRS